LLPFFRIFDEDYFISKVEAAAAQVEKSDVRSCHAQVRSCNLDEILQESDKNLRLRNLASDHTTSSLKILHVLYFRYKLVAIFLKHISLIKICTDISLRNRISQESSNTI
jgi:hypothetical protein